MRKQFTEFWESLGSRMKSLIISISAIVLATLVLFVSRIAYPNTDFSQVEIIVTTGISGFAISLIKDFVKTK